MLGYSIESLYLYALILSGSLTFLYILFGDVLDGMLEGAGIQPVLLFSFFTFFSAGGYLLERIQLTGTFFSACISLTAAFIFTVILNVFVLIPLASAEESLVYFDEDLKGRVGEVLTSIPVNGYGEVLLKSNSGSIAKPAASFEDIPVPSGSEVIIIDIKNGILYVSIYEKLEDLI
ncbi:hypothetical protein GJU40_18360 [Bacillus lacus]|uniref:Membrane protein NfeD2 N-terminal transmembrane domain-containing protein n=1 Tax=Metabacillus lacus TaxID=1983721 RepID=A0A7X2LYZ3_9BACI|nr:hypothetical protein [Metabacillus lacus]